MLVTFETGLQDARLTCSRPRRAQATGPTQDEPHIPNSSKASYAGLLLTWPRARGPYGNADEGKREAALGPELSSPSPVSASVKRGPQYLPPPKNSVGLQLYECENREAPYILWVMVQV